MANAAVAADFHQPLHVKRNFTTQVSLDMEFLVQSFSELADFIFCQVSYPGIGVNTAFF